MGQYYRVFVEKEKAGKKKNTRHVFHPGDAGWKLMEHAWCGNPLPDAISGLLYHNPMRIAWVGDYTNRKVYPEAEYTWNYLGIEDGTRSAKPLELIGKVLVNHTWNTYLDFDEYAYVSRDESIGMCIHPLPILTALACNGQSGSDYFGVNMLLAGAWALDTVSVEDEPPADCVRIVATFREEPAFDDKANPHYDFQKERVLTLQEDLRRSIYGRYAARHRGLEEAGA